jgi:hypothetical protein
MVPITVVELAARFQEASPASAPSSIFHFCNYSRQWAGLDPR